MTFNFISKKLDYTTKAGKTIRLAHCSGNSTTCGMSTYNLKDFEETTLYTLNTETPSQITFNT